MASIRKKWNHKTLKSVKKLIWVFNKKKSRFIFCQYNVKNILNQAKEMKQNNFKISKVWNKIKMINPRTVLKQFWKQKPF